MFDAFNASKDFSDCNDRRISPCYSKYKWFFKRFNGEERKEIFEIIYNYLFKNDEKFEIRDSPESLVEYINTKDSRYINKTNLEIITLFKLKGSELNNKLEKYKIKLIIKEKYSLYIVDKVEENYMEISCLRNIRFEDQFEWICSHFIFYIFNIIY